MEPLTDERVLEIIKKEMSKGDLLGVITQLGGQTSLRLSQHLEEANIPIIGTSFKSILLSEDRKKFSKLLKKLNLNQPESLSVNSILDAKRKLNTFKYPVLVRPSNVLGGRSMKILNSSTELEHYLNTNSGLTRLGSLLIDNFLKNATEVDVDAICDGEQTYIAGIMEHIEKAGIHSGDSACVLPPFSLKQKILNDIKNASLEISKGLKVKGLLNIQFAVCNNKLFVLEANPRASRSLPFVIKSTGVPLVEVAIGIMLGKKLKDFNLHNIQIKHYSVKESVFAFTQIPDADMLLGPEMKSTGECMGWDSDIYRAFSKSQLAAGNKIPDKGVLLALDQLTFKEKGLVNKLSFKKVFLDKYTLEKNEQELVQFIKDNKINMVYVNNKTDECKNLRRAILISGICYFTSFESFKLAVNAISMGKTNVKDINEIQSLPILEENQLVV